MKKYVYSGCGQVVQGTGHKAKRLVLEFKSCQGKNKNVSAQRSNSNTNTVWINFQTYIYIGGGCGRVVQGAGRKAKRLVLQCINGVSSNPVEGRTKI